MKHSKKNEHVKRVSVPPSGGSRVFSSHDRKAMQLCSQVRYALEYAINDVMHGEYGLTVTSVVPAPNTSHLLVLVQAFEVISFDQSSLLESELNSHSKSLRTVVAESIRRRKTPGLSFQIVPKSPSS